MRVEQRGGDLHLKMLIDVQQIDQGRRIDRSVAHQLARGLIQLRAAALQVGARFGILHQRGRGAHRREKAIQNLGGSLGVDRALAGELFATFALQVPGRMARGVPQLCAELAHLRERARKQARNLRLQRPGVHNLAQRRIGCERQQVARRIEGPRLQGALVALLLHAFGTRQSAPQRLGHPVAQALVGGKQRVHGGVVLHARARIQGRRVPAGAPEVLVPRGALLAVPAGLIHQRDCG